MILGAFNSPEIGWGDISISHYDTYVLQNASALLDLISFTGLEQCNHVVNSAGSLLDLCFSNIENLSVNISPTRLVIPDNYHPPLSIVLPIQSDVQKAKPRVSKCPSYNFAAGGYISFYQYLSNFDWSVIVASNDPNYQASKLTKVLQEDMRRYIPLKKSKSWKCPFWFSGELRSALEGKESAHRKVQKSGVDKWKLEFKGYWSLCKKL